MQNAVPEIFIWFGQRKKRDIASIAIEVCSFWPLTKNGTYFRMYRFHQISENYNAYAAIGRLLTGNKQYCDLKDVKLFGSAQAN